MKMKIDQQHSAPTTEYNKELPNIDIQIEEKRVERKKKIAILVLTFDRTEYLEKTLNRLYEQIEQSSLSDRFDVIVSQDGDTSQVTHFLHNQQLKRPQLRHLMHDRSNNVYPPNTKKSFLAYFAIAQHYKWALQQVFSLPEQYNRALVLEDDLEIAPDALEYFNAMSWLLDADPTLMCISGWNDQGMDEYVVDPSAFHRTDLFPGLGWMLSRNLWNEIQDRWPQGFWDDRLREPEQRQQRACIRPEVPRSATFGKKGASGGQFYRKYLSRIHSNDIAPVNFDRLDTSQFIKENYDEWLTESVENANTISMAELKQLPDTNPIVAAKSNGYKLKYKDMKDLSKISKHLKLIDDPKSGIPRAAYMGGIIPIKYKGHPLYIVPKESVYNY
eukprot:gb/GECH01006816.1/.p1 GENE.gb/GECH01006816.1/~~gb/GECH01006816.1/.p1  ORF type:complete len:387 (+),score=88.35 gb/GECH01006816.1/:1-1161(+)